MGRKHLDTTDSLNTHKGGVNSGCNGGGEGVGDRVGVIVVEVMEAKFFEYSLCQALC